MCIKNNVSRDPLRNAIILLNHKKKNHHIDDHSGFTFHSLKKKKQQQQYERAHIINYYIYVDITLHYCIVFTHSQKKKKNVIFNEGDFINPTCP